MSTDRGDRVQDGLDDQVDAGGADVAIVGMACRFPGAPDVARFWGNLVDGVESITRFSAAELAALGVPAELRDRPGFVPVGAVVPDVEAFDHRFWGYSPREAALLDPQQRLFLETAWSAMEHAGYATESYDGMVGVYAGMGLSTYLLYALLDNPDVGETDTQMAMLGNDKDFLSSRVSYHLDLRGPSLAVQTGCSTSLVATHLACEGLLSHQCDMALVGGATVVLPERTGYVHFPGSTASSDGHCRAFDAAGDGTVFGSGAGVVVLKRLADAVTDGDTVYAVIKGSAVNNDGANRVGFTAPSLAGQAEVVLRAQQVAGVDPASISYIEAHGTATVLGDPVEIAALTTAFRQSTDRTGFCGIGSVKTNIGHLDAAAGVAGLIKTALSLYHKQIPPSLNFTEPNPRIDFGASPFYVQSELTGWPSGPTPRRAGVSAFGFGGTNAHVVLEEAAERTVPSTSDGPQLVVLSAKTPAALSAAGTRLADHLDGHRELSLADVASTLQRGRTSLEHRTSVVAGTVADAVAALRGVDPAISARRDRTPDSGRPVAFMCAGLGDQYQGMGRDLFERLPVFRAVVDECAAELRPHLGVDLRTVLYPADAPAHGRPAGIDLRAMVFGAVPDGPLQRTALAHPALFTVEYALAMQWMAWGVRPSALIGHSLGEYVAATIAGVFTLPDALRVVAGRARLFDAMPAGAMLAVPLGSEETAALLTPGLEVALVNGPRLTAVSGPVVEIEDLARRLAERGVVARRMQARQGFHSQMVAAVAEPLAALLGQVRLSPPRIPLVSNVTGDWLDPARATDPAYWAEHSVRPVQFADGVATLCADRDQVLVEIGPGQALSALATERLAETDAADLVVLPSLRSSYGHGGDDDVAHLLDTLGRAWCAGAAVDWNGLHEPGTRTRVPLPTYPFERQRCRVTTEQRTRPAVTGRTANPDEWLYVPSWRSLPMPTPLENPWRPKEHWLVFADATGVSADLVACVAKAGHQVTVVEPGTGFAPTAEGFRLDPGNPADYVALVAAIEEWPTRVAHLWSMAETDDRDLGVHSLLWLARALARRATVAPVDVWMVGTGLVAVEQADVLRPAKAMLLGVATCVRQEYEGVDVRCVDATGADPTFAGRLMDAVAEQLDERLLAYRGTRRWAQTFEPLVLGASRTPLRDGGVYVITGGLGGIGLDLADHIVDHADVVLIGRSPFPEQAEWAAWTAAHSPDDVVSRRIARVRALLRRDHQVLVYQADVADEERMADILADVERRLGAIDGVFHAAGVVGEQAFAPIDQLDAAGIAAVMRAKVEGTEALARALGTREPDFVLLLSSNAAVLGGLGTAAYTASSAFLDAFAQAAAARPGPRWISVDMEDWLPDSGMDRPVTSVTQYGIGVSDGVRSLLRVAEKAPAGQVALVTGDLEKRLDLWVRHPDAARRGSASSDGARAPRPTLTADYVAPDDDVEVALAEIWARLLGIEPIGRDDDFYELGGHSLLATQIVARLRARFGGELSLLDLLSSPTVAGLADIVRAGPKGQAAPAAIPLASRDEPLPLSYGQQRFWIIDQLAPGSPVYNIPDVARIQGPLDVAVLRGAINDVIARHETLRTSFHLGRDGEPEQRIATAVDMPVPLADLRHEPADRWRVLALADAERPFDLGEPPLMRATVLQIADEEHVLLLTMHHSVADAWSTGVYIRELAVHYAARVGAGDGDLPSLAVQYGDYAVWQRAELAGARRTELAEHWRGVLAGAPSLVEFPPDHRRPATRTFAGASLPITLTDELVVELRKLGAGEGATLFMTLLTAFCCLLHRHAGERDVVIGSPIAGRTRPELEPLIGAFVNMLAFRTTVDPMCTARELLAQVRDSTLDAYAHQDLPFELVVEALRPDRSLDHEPVFQNVLVLQNAPLPPLELAGLRVEHVPMPATYAKFDLMVTLRETGDGAVGTIEYATDLFTPDTVARIGRHYVAILEKIAAMPDRPVAELELLSGKEIELVTRQWAHGTAGSADGESIPARIGVVAAARPREPAILSAVDSADRVTFGELETWSNQLGHALAARGIGPESRVGVCLDRSPATLVLLLAILKAGAAYVPLDPAYPLPRLRFMLEDAAVDLVVVEDVHRHRLGEIHTGQVELTELWRDRGEFPDAPLDRVLAPAQPAYLLYTSGSTGTPKGVLGLHGGMVNRLRWMWRTHPFAPGEVACQKTSLNFLDSFWEVFGPLGQGVPVVVVPQPALTDPHVLVGMLAAHRVSRLVLVPSLLRTLLDTVPDLAARLPALRFWVSSGEPLTADLAARFLAVLPGRDLLNLYGASEVSADVTGHLIRQSDVDSESIPLGRPIAGTAVYVLDELLRPVPPGTVGDLYVGGVALARGYAGRPDLTAERFLPDPFSRQPGGLLYRTGDRGRFRADGAVEYAGRYDHQVKVRGFRVEPAEVENVLIAHTDVVEAVVSAEDDVLVAYCVAAPGAAIDAEVLRTHLRSILPAFMVPSMFVARTALPLTPSGKVDRTALRRNELGPDELRALSRSVVTTAPRDEAERTVLRLLREVLGADHEIGVHDNFWLFGGHSLLATRFVARVRESFDARFTLEQFFLDPTVVGVVAALRAGRRAGLPGGPVLMAKPDRRQAPLSYPQRQLWLFEQMFPGTGAYNVPAAVRLSGPFDEQALRAALDTVVSRHAVLRSVFVQAGEEPEQRIEPVGTYEFTRHDLRRAADQERSARELAAAVSARPFDLAAGPLLRADVAVLATGEHLLVLTMHHIVGDAWSWAVLLHEVSTVYAAAARGAAAPALPPLPLQYGDVAQWQRDRVRSGELDRQLDYWRARLADAPPVLELPTDRPRPAAPGFLGATVDFELDEADVAGLRTLAGQESATLFMAVLSVFDVLLHRYSGRTDFIVGTSVASRGQPEVEPMIGCLVNTVMVRANVADAHTFRGVLRSVRDSAAGALANQDVPFETIVDRLRPPRAAPSAPHFQIMLTLRAAARLDLMDELLPSPFSVHNGTSKRDLTLNLVEDGATVSAQIEYDTALFEHDRVVRMADHFRRLLAAAVAGPDTPVGRLPMLTETEQVVVAELRDTAVAYPDAGTCVHELFQRQAERTPAAVAVRFEESTLTYTELARHASRLAHLLRGRGVGPETPVGLCLPPSLSMVVAVLGVLSAGGAYVPIDPRDPLDRQHAILRDAGARVVVHHLTDMAWRDAPYDSVALDDTWSTIDGYPDVPPPTLAEPANAAYVLYTSGSTGASKGVVVEHRQVVNYVLAVLDRLGISEPLGYAMVQPLTVDSCVTMLVPPLVTGGVLHVIARDRALDADRLAEYFSAHPVDCLKIAPSHLRALRQSGRGADLLPRRALVVGGEAADWRWLRALADDAGECAVHNHYGPTEATVGVLTFSATGHTEPDAVTAPLGRPLANTRAVVLDHDGRQVPVGVPGELYVGGANVARGYLGRPDLTAEAFVPDPAGGLLYRTGDVVRLRIDGAVEFLGRRDDQVKIRGYRVELGEIEATLGSAPDVRAAVAAVRADGPGEPRLIGYVVPVTGRRVDQAALRTFLRECLPAHMVPSALVELTELPLSAHGKVDRRALPAPAGDAAVRVRPRTDVERTIAGVWSELLGVERVGVEENFFDLGGHSLLLIGLHQRLQAALGTRFELVQLFRFSTVRAQAGLVTDEAGAIGVDDAKQRGRRQSEPLRRQRRRKRGHTDG